MNAKQKGKIDLMLSGFGAKYEQAPDYFIALRWTVVSGGKTYNGSAEREETGGFLYSFAGTRQTESMEELLGWISDAVLRYDSAKIEYWERGRLSRICADDRNVRMEKEEIQEDASAFGLKNKKYNLDLKTAAPLLKVLGFMTEDGKLRNSMIRKYNQTDRFLDLVGDLFDGKNNLTVVDCACGKSYLSFILNHYLWEKKHIRANFVAIDIKDVVIRDSNEMAEKLGYKNMKFVCEDLRFFDEGQPDAVISLHACDTATDMALGYAIRNNARIIVCVPCCHKELLDQYRMPQLDGILRHGIFRARMNDILTDGLLCMKLEACGYRVSCVEYCSPLDTPKNLLIRAEKVSDGNPEAEASYRKLLAELGVHPAIETYSCKIPLV